MNYQRFIDDQEALANISLAYKNDPEFRASLDANPMGIFVDNLPQTEGEIIIVQNTEEDFYFVLTANISQAIDDDETHIIAAAAIEFLEAIETKNGYRSLFQNTETGDLFRRYKSDPSDPQGQSHFIRVEQHRLGARVEYTDVGGVINV